MKKTLSLLLFIMIVARPLVAQPSKHPLRVVDTLTPLEKTTRNPILLQSEVDSLIKNYLAQQPPPEPVQAAPPVVKQETPMAVWVVLGSVIILAGAVLLAVFRKQTKTSRQLRDLLLELRGSQAAANLSTTGKQDAMSSDAARKVGSQSLQERLDAYENVKTEMMKTYKIRSYPGYESTTVDERLLAELVKTERAIADYAYEHFVKPVIAITDANKNHPARMRKEDSARIVELLLSLALFYSEYLYLRLPELAIGAQIAERIRDIRQNAPLREELLKSLNREHGSRALVLRIALDKINIRELSYPVFDETNLNAS